MAVGSNAVTRDGTASPLPEVGCCISDHSPVLTCFVYLCSLFPADAVLYVVYIFILLPALSLLIFYKNDISSITQVGVGLYFFMYCVALRHDPFIWLSSQYPRRTGK